MSPPPYETIVNTIKTTAVDRVQVVTRQLIQPTKTLGASSNEDNPWGAEGIYVTVRDDESRLGGTHFITCRHVVIGNVYDHFKDYTSLPVSTRNASDEPPSTHIS
ncbi:hypothetical protein SEUCBS139899_009924 [Sporothrix eucalyptigena]